MDRPGPTPHIGDLNPQFTHLFRSSPDDGKVHQHLKVAITSGVRKYPRLDSYTCGLVHQGVVYWADCRTGDEQWIKMDGDQARWG
ncbi:MAG: hypothetical protein ACRDRT_14845 [Pseudonocardiaceae bacterium]